jgi:hypothetical protein
MGAGKRERESAKARKKEEKAQRRLERRERGPGEVPIVSAEEALAGLPSVEEAMAALERRATEPRSATAIPARLFVGGLSDGVTEQDLRATFGAIGPAVSASSRWPTVATRPAPATSCTGPTSRAGTSSSTSRPTGGAEDGRPRRAARRPPTPEPRREPAEWSIRVT